MERKIGEIFEAPVMGKATAQLDHRYYGESYNKTRLDVSLESSEGDMKFSGNKSVNFVEMTEGYVEKVSNVIEKVKIYGK